MDILNSFVSFMNTMLWSYILIFMLIGLGLYFTFRSKFVQFRLFGEMFRLLPEHVAKSTSDSKQKIVSPFEAFCISAASRIGTGNLAGVALAIAIGGPGCGVLDVGYRSYGGGIWICRKHFGLNL